MSILPNGSVRFENLTGTEKGELEAAVSGEGTRINLSSSIKRINI